jgi:hypothetical protein
MIGLFSQYVQLKGYGLHFRITGAQEKKYKCNQLLKNACHRTKKLTEETAKVPIRIKSKLI